MTPSKELICHGMHNGDKIIMTMHFYMGTHVPFEITAPRFDILDNGWILKSHILNCLLTSNDILWLQNFQQVDMIFCLSGTSINILQVLPLSDFKCKECISHQTFLFNNTSCNLAGST